MSISTGAVGQGHGGGAVGVPTFSNEGRVLHHFPVIISRNIWCYRNVINVTVLSLYNIISAPKKIYRLTIIFNEQR